MARLFTAGVWVALVMFVNVSSGQDAQGQEGSESLRQQALALNRVNGDAAIANKIRELRKDRDSLRKLLAEAKALVKEATKNQDKDKEPPLNYTASYILASAAHMTKDYDAGEFFYKLCFEHAFKLGSTQRMAQVLEAMIDMFDRAKRYNEALFVCTKFLELKVEKDDDDTAVLKPFVLERMVQIYSRKHEFGKALELVNDLVKRDEGGFYFLRRKAEVLRESGKSDEAIALFKEVLEKIDKHDGLNADGKKRQVQLTKYMLSSTYVDVNKIDESVALLEELLAANPKNPTYNNDLGYILADNDRRLGDAEKLVDKALEIEREARKEALEKGLIGHDDDQDSSAYLDSLAWVYFKQKKYDKALELMKKVIESDDAQHVEIYDHLGDVYHALGQKDEAIKAWKKGLKQDNVSHRDEARKEAVKKKIEAN